MSTIRLVVIGGSAAGAKAAAKARRLDESADITIIEKSPDLSVAACGFPYYVGGEFDERKKLLSAPTGALRDPVFFAKTKNIKALINTEVLSIDRQGKSVLCRNSAGETSIPYDKLIIATGAKANRPPIPNINLKGISSLLTMQDADYLRNIRDEGKVKNTVIIGGGLIGVEVAEALQLSGFNVTIVELLDQILPFLDWEMAKLVEKQMARKGVQLLTTTGVKEFLGKNGHVTGISLANGETIACDLAVLAMGVRPNSDIAAKTGLDIGKLGGISVNSFMQTSDPNIYAAGDCVEIIHRNTKQATFSPMGDLANLEGRAAGENALLGNRVSYKGTFQTGICKIFTYNAGATGLSEKAARKAGFNNIEVVINAGADKPTFMKAKSLISKMVVDKTNNRLIGFQCVGTGDVGREISMAAVAMQGKLCIEDIVNSDLPYAPPFSPAIDHFIVSAHIMENKVTDRIRGISSAELLGNAQKDDNSFIIIDVREQGEFKKMHLGLGETLIPLNQIRKNLDQLPRDKNKEIICLCKVGLRSYEASQILIGNGYTNVKILDGGLMAWPYEIKR